VHHMIVEVSGRTTARLHEVRVPIERELQKVMKDNPELLPTDELGFEREVLLVGRETALPSGKPDLLAVSETGELLVIEMKRGPENSDFRRALAQLIDYGSDLWRMPLERFAGDIAVPYFGSKHCRGLVRGASTLEEAISRSWPDAETEPRDVLANLASNLRTGQFTYVLAAQSLTPSMVRAVEYMNATSVARFFGVELVKFEDDERKVIAYEGRLAIGPSRPPRTVAAQDDLVTRFSTQHRGVVQRLLDTANRLQVTVFTGAVGASLRVEVPELATPVSVAWLYPDGHNGFGGAKQLTLGFAKQAFDKLVGSERRLVAWREAVGRVPAAASIDGAAVSGVVVPWEQVPAHLPAIITALELLVADDEEMPAAAEAPADPEAQEAAEPSAELLTWNFNRASEDFVVQPAPVLSVLGTGTGVTFVERRSDVRVVAGRRRDVATYQGLNRPGVVVTVERDGAVLACSVAAQEDITSALATLWSTETASALERDDWVVTLVQERGDFRYGDTAAGVIVAELSSYENVRLDVEPRNLGIYEAPASVGLAGYLVVLALRTLGCELGTQGPVPMVEAEDLLDD
jgi:hypothetical protein